MHIATSEILPWYVGLWGFWWFWRILRIQVPYQGLKIIRILRILTDSDDSDIQTFGLSKSGHSDIRYFSFMNYLAYSNTLVVCRRQPVDLARNDVDYDHCPHSIIHLPHVVATTCLWRLMQIPHDPRHLVQTVTLQFAPKWHTLRILHIPEPLVRVLSCYWCLCTQTIHISLMRPSL